MLRKASISMLALAAILFGTLIILAIAYFSHGSLEAFPTDTQQSKVKIATTMIVIFLGLLEVLTVFLLCRKIRGKI